MENDTDYECYLLGCQSAGLAPLKKWRFQLLQKQYLRWTSELERKPEQDAIPPFVLEQLALLVAEGYRIAAGSRDEGEEPGTAACGVREPRVPLEPVLAGSAARSLPYADAPDLSFWRT